IRGWWRILRRATNLFESFHGGRPEGRPSLFCPKFVMSTRSLRQFTKHRIIEAMKQVVHAACPHDCPDACGVLIPVDESTAKAVSLRGDQQNPVTRGCLCAKVAQYLDRVYSPDRVLYPMKRTAPKGAGKGGFSDFERITWDKALAAIASRFKNIVDEFGGEAILPYSYGGSLAVLNGSSMDHRFCHRLGASR